MKKYLLILLLIPSISWSDIMLDCDRSISKSGASKLIYALNLEKETLTLIKVFDADGYEMKLINNYPSKFFEISNGVIYTYLISPEKGRFETWLDTNSLKIFNQNRLNNPDICTASEKIQLTSQSDTMNAVKECEDIGFKKGTDKFLNCVLELSE